MNLQSFALLLIFGLFGVGVYYMVDQPRKRALIEVNVREWAIAVQSYIDANCESGLTQQTDESLTTLDPIFKHYGLAWSYNPMTRLSTVTIDDDKAQNSFITRQRAIGLIKTQVISNEDSGNINFDHRELAYMESLSSSFSKPVLAVHEINGDCV